MKTYYLGKRKVTISKKLIANKVCHQIKKFDLFTLPIYKKAVQSCCVDIVELFAKYSSKSFEYYIPLNGNDLLRESIMAQNECVVNYILKNELCDINLLQNKNRVIENITQEPLILAITSNNAALVKQLINAKFDVNIKISEKLNPLSFACIINNFEIVKMLVKAGAKISKYYYFVELPIAARNGNFELVQYLLVTYKKQQGFDKKLSINTLKMKFKLSSFNHHSQQFVDSREILKSNNSRLQSFNQSPSNHILSFHSQTSHQYQKQQKQKYIYGNCLYAAVYALANGHGDIYNYLMNYSYYFSKNNQIYKVPMVIALSENNLNTVKYLHKKGISLSQTFNFNISLANSVIKIISKYCDVEYHDESLIDLDNTTLLHYSVWKSEYNIVNYLLENKVNINYQCSKGYTALMIATKNCDMRMVNILVANGADINLKDKQGVTALFIACLNGYFNLVQYLIDCGGDINAITKYKENMLLITYQLAIGNNQIISERYENTYFNLKGIKQPRCMYESIVNYLISQNIDITLRDCNDISAIDYAVVNNRALDAKFFISRGASPNCQFFELDLLKYSILKEWLTMVRLLINSGVDLEKKDKHNNTPLLCAISTGNLDIVKELVNAGANLKVKNDKGLSPLMCAVQNKNINIIHYLLTLDIDINEKDKHGFTVLMHAIADPNYSMRNIEYLVDHGADVNTKSDQLLTPLLLAAKNNYIDVAKYLISKEANVNDMDSIGYNSLMYAVLNHNIALIALLIENHIEIDERNCKDYTALMIASENGYFDIVKYLVENGADISLKAKRRTSALKLANKSKYYNIADYLVFNTNTSTTTA
jgi:ankyrin repeat protein